VANYNIKLSNILYHWQLSMASFCFCETNSLHIKPFVLNKSAISPFLGGMCYRHVLSTLESTYSKIDQVSHTYACPQAERSKEARRTSQRLTVRSVRLCDVHMIYTCGAIYTSDRTHRQANTCHDIDACNYIHTTTHMQPHTSKHTDES